MTFLWIYFACGSLLALVALVVGFRARIDSPEGGLRYAHEVTVVLALCLSIWPLILVVLGWSALSERSRQNAPLLPPFRPERPQPPEGIEELSIDDVEARERVLDPLNGAPDLPFGHLHDAWLAFRAKVPADATLWAFKSKYRSDFGRRTIREGYAFGSGGETIHFCTVITADDESEPR